MKKNFYLIEAYILGHMATFIFSKYFLLIHSDFNDVIIFLLLKIKFDNLLNSNYVRKGMYFFIFVYIFFKNYIILRLN